MRHRFCSMLATLVVGAAPAFAEPPLEQPLDEFLTQRTTEELAVRDTLLSRMGLVLYVETTVDDLTVELHRLEMMGSPRGRGCIESAAIARSPSRR